MNRKQKYTDEDLVNYLQDYTVRYGNVPSSTNIDRNKEYPSASVFIKRFGSFKHALTEAGLDRLSYKSNKYDDEFLKNSYKCAYDYYGKSPTKKEYNRYATENNYPSSNTLIRRFGNFNNISNLLNLKITRRMPNTYDEDFLISELIRFHDEHGRVPLTNDLEGGNGYPNRKIYSKWFGSLNEALTKSGFCLSESLNQHRTKKLPEGIIKFNKVNLKEFFFKFIDEFGYVPSVSQMESAEGYPTRNDYRRVYGSWNNAIIEYGFEIRNKTYNDVELKDAFERFVKENGRVPSLPEFNNSEYPSFWCYQDRFGSWTNAIKSYGYNPIGRKEIAELKDDIIKLCNEIYEKEERKTINYNDISESVHCSSISTYLKHFKKHGNTTLREFVKSIGFRLAHEGSFGMIHEFEDGEVTVSKLEFDVSTYFKGNHIKYDRNVEYEEFISEYEGKKDCDYVVHVDGEKWYIEIAGMIMEDEIHDTSEINIEYRKRLKEKIAMLSSEELNYKIIYPNNLKEKTFDEIFSFLL